MSDILKRIEAYKREEIAAAKRAHPLSEVEARAKAASPPRGFVQAIRKKLAAGQDTPSNVGELPPAGLGVGCLVQEVPFQVSASVTVVPEVLE